MESVIIWLSSINIVVPAVFLAVLAVGLFCYGKINRRLDRDRVVKRLNRIVAEM